MKITAEPRSDQINADDFVGGTEIYTIAGVRPGTAEQKYDIDLVELEGRCWRPPLTMLRLLINVWGETAADWVGQKVELYRDPKVSFGKEQVGGIRISAVSGIDKPVTVSVTVARGRRSRITVNPLAVEAKITAEQWGELVTAAGGDGAAAGQKASEVVGRQLAGWQDIPADRFAEILGALNA